MGGFWKRWLVKRSKVTLTFVQLFFRGDMDIIMKNYQDLRMRQFKYCFKALFYLLMRV